MVVPKDMEVEAAVVAEQVMVVEHTEVDMEVVVELVVVTVAVVKKEEVGSETCRTVGQGKGGQGC
ncbi:hypothetical protein, partial [Escherichia coli]|uniref:hypothetical protein n=1 Tax=Escherichia coli TaxID=562 RepID=UPI0020BEAA4C